MPTNPEPLEILVVLAPDKPIRVMTRIGDADVIMAMLADGIKAVAENELRKKAAAGPGIVAPDKGLVVPPGLKIVPKNGGA